MEKKKGEIKEQETFTITIEGGYYVEIEKPKRNVFAEAMGYIMRINENPDFIKAGEVILLQCKIKSSPEVVRENEDIWMAACLGASQALKLPGNSIKKN